MEFTSLCNAAGRRNHRAGALASVFILALATMPARAANAETYYVDNQSPNGSLAGPGTEGQPYSTITAAVAARRGPGVTIVVKPGIYREQITIPESGTQEAPYVLRAEGPGVVLEGCDDFKDETLWIEPGPGAIPGTLGAVAHEYGWLAPGVTSPVRQVFVDGRRLTASAGAPGLLPPNAFTWVEGEGLYVNLDGGNPGRHEILVGRRTYGFRMSGKSWVTIEGFELTHIDDTAINLHLGCSDIVVSGNRITFSGSYGIKSAGGLRVLIEGNSVSESGLHGIGLTAGSTGCVIRNNDSFRNAQQDVRAAKGIYLQMAPSNVIAGNRTYENQDTGIQINNGSHHCLLYNNRSWHNGDHGFDHLDATGTTHLHNVAYGNFMDGFSIEGNSPGSQVFNCISVDNGLSTDRFNLWVNGLSAVGFQSGYNILWNSTTQEPVKFIATKYNLLSDYVADSGQDAHSMQANPLFANATDGDFRPLQGSPAIDAGNSGVANWPVYDVAGHLRIDDPTAPNAGTGLLMYADIGAFEYLPPAVEEHVVATPLPRNRPMGRGAQEVSGSAARLDLSAGFPNPTRGPVEFALDLPSASHVEWAVYDLQGRAVWSQGGTLGAGRNQLRWDGTARAGEPAATGIYLVRARVDGTHFTRRIIRF